MMTMMKAAALLLVACVVLAAADSDDRKKDKAGAGKPNARFLGGLGGGLPGHHGVGVGGHLGLGSGGFFSGAHTGGFGFGFGGGFPSPVAPPSTCRHWCRTPQNQAYCCEDNRQPPSLVGVVKPGVCPPVRPVCPNTRNFQPPAPCSNDGACGGFDKCCFDTCLQQHVCKLPIQHGFGGGFGGFGF